ncbi:hypothetical protein EKG37_01675 [Robertmurraya yapensis]|uniref:Uncharacterized protein n=1 Tax=Bacillus yapensis TaxID=2492960 RepID=A0A3S0RU31_9BACI|nr:hypothetical protein [Bacillus yapensis]RTR36293.1 hypothetical protein EKG37_01675 [Bacillus yapensis]TKT05796.1 hypothetical protein FAR12_01675 [Bacillus yapensis]
MKERYLWIGLLLVVLSWGGNYLYFESKQLDEPIFMKHFYEQALPIRNEDEEVTDTNYYESEGIQLTFYYLTNKYDNVDVVDVYIDGAEVYVDSGGFDYEFFGTSEPIHHVEQEFRHYYLKSVTVGIHPEAFATGMPGDRWTFENMEVYFDNQEMMTANIGKVALLINDSTPEILEQRMGSGSNDGQSKSVFVSLKPLTVEDISVPFANEISDVFKAKVDIDDIELRKELEDGEDIPSGFEEQSVDWENTPGILLKNVEFPFKMETDERLSLNVFLNPNRTSFLELASKITGTTESGESFVSYAGIIDHPYVTQRAIEQLIAEKEGEKE